MKILINLGLSCLLLFTFAVSHASASNLAKEKRWAEQIEDALLEGESVTLNDGKLDFYSIYTSSSSSPNSSTKEKDTTILLLHGMGVHPDWPQVINPLRVALPEQGWSTLSIQLPVLENEASGKDYLPLYKDVPARLNAAITFLKDKGAKKIIIVAHSLGTEMATYSLSISSENISGFIGIGMGGDNIPYLSKIKLPTLDLYGENDLPGIVASAKQRVESAKHNKHYQQQRISNAGHFFDEHEEPLIEAVTHWLNEQAK